VEKIRGILKKQFDISVAGGQDHLKGKILRVGHLGFVSERDILTVIAAIESALLQLGHTATSGSGVAATAKILGS
jgi:aspartate aminotransferase-like enzyme